MATVVARTNTAARRRNRQCYRDRKAAPDARSVTVAFAASQIGLSTTGGTPAKTESGTPTGTGPTLVSPSNVGSISRTGATKMRLDGQHGPSRDGGSSCEADRQQEGRRNTSGAQVVLSHRPRRADGSSALKAGEARGLKTSAKETRTAQIAPTARRAPSSRAEEQAWSPQTQRAYRTGIMADDTASADHVVATSSVPALPTLGC